MKDAKAFQEWWGKNKDVLPYPDGIQYRKAFQAGYLAGQGEAYQDGWNEGFDSGFNQASEEY